MTKTFPEVISGIRTAKRGVEVREDIAQMGEYVEQFAATATEKAEAAAASEKKASDAVANIDQQTEDAVAAVNTAKTNALQDVETARTGTLTDIGNARSGAVQAVTDTKTAALTALEEQRAAALQEMQTSVEAAAGSAEKAAASEEAAAKSETNSAASKSAAQKSAEEAAASAALAGTRAGTDKTLRVEDAPADAKKVGDELVVRYTKEEVDGKLAGKLDLAGGTMTGPLILMGGLTALGCATNAGSHNSNYRGKNITSKFSDGTLFTNIADGTFDDLFVGDYFVDTCNGVTTNWRLSGFDVYYNCGDVALTRHHAAVIPDDILLTEKMNSSNTTSGGYIGSKMYKETIPNLETKIRDMIGADHLIKYRVSLTNSVASSALSSAGSGLMGSVNGTAWVDITVRLCNEVEVCGNMEWSSSARDAGIMCVQLPLFALNPSLRMEKSSNLWWLSSVSTNEGFCRISNTGDSGFSISSSARGVRPVFLIG